MLQVHENMNIRLMNSFFLNAITTLKSDTHQMQHATTTMKHFNLNSNLGLSWTIWTFQHICFNWICWTWLYVTFRYALLALWCHKLTILRSAASSRTHLTSLWTLSPNALVDMWGRVWTSRFTRAWTSLNFYKEYLFGFETLVFATSGILSMHKQLVTLQRESKTLNRIIWPL